MVFVKATQDSEAGTIVKSLVSCLYVTCGTLVKSSVETEQCPTIANRSKFPLYLKP